MNILSVLSELILLDLLLKHLESRLKFSSQMLLLFITLKQPILNLVLKRRVMPLQRIDKVTKTNHNSRYIIHILHLNARLTDFHRTTQCHSMSIKIAPIGLCHCILPDLIHKSCVGNLIVKSIRSKNDEVMRSTDLESFDLRF